jgi:acetate kinase
MLEMKTPSEDVKALGFFSPSSPLHENCFFREAFEKILHLLVGSCGWKIACLNESKRRSEQHMQLLELPGAAEVFTKYPEELEEEKKKRKSEKEALERLIQSYMDIEASAKNAREIIQSPTHESIDAFLSQLHNMGHRLTMIEKNPE